MPALPYGAILLWHGSIATIPAGYALCDGTLGTPDLRDRFIIGASPAYPVGNTGGSTAHTHDFTGDGHTHDIPPGFLLAAGTSLDDTVYPTAVTGTTDSTATLPRYYALAFIMRIL